jgi:multidrug efflux pump subunit AcrA (membrane-fusion protein)
MLVDLATHLPIHWPDRWKELSQLPEDELVARIERLQAQGIDLGEHPDVLLLNSESAPQVVELLEKIQTQSEEIRKLQRQVDDLKIRMDTLNEDLRQLEEGKEQAEARAEAALAEIAQLNGRNRLLLALLGIVALASAGTTLWAWRRGSARR